MTARLMLDVSMIACEHKKLIANTGDGQELYSAVSIDRYGGHRHYFVVRNGNKNLETESLAEAIRFFNGGAK